ncbi:nucleotidyltransferase family protein [Enterobacteriaceae bacterium EKM102V]|uniref:nucleotidyltransferase family protein n=1 Tax=Pantoea TaxID=53335 RepID=UPI00142D64A9|nr:MULTISPECIES: nucleotidyltransferase family protein [Pantoea]KAF6660277.1 nucleotidyltransferase family protein [Enterobacteriaceae bacterium EKM102V]KAF6669884.1 nucleotidyltransferase family protein [Pantoea sp. EKM103V]
MKIALIVLAAGLSRRFRQQGGEHKLLARLDGKPLLQHTLEQAAASGLDLFVVTRPDAAALQALCTSATLVLCDSGGLGESIAAGVNATRDYDGWLIALGDMPFVSVASYRAVSTALADAPVVRPWVAGRPGHPVGFQRHCYPVLSRLQGDSGPQALVNASAVRLPLHDRGCLCDIDFPADLQLIKEFS